MSVEYLSMEQVAALLGRHPVTVTRWCRLGCRGIALEHRLFGSRMVTTLEWLDAFGRASAKKSPPPATSPTAAPPSSPRTERRRAADMAAAEATCARFGI